MNNFVRNPQVIWDQVDGKTVLCHIDTGDFFYMDFVGKQIWEVCDLYTFDDLVEQIYTNYPRTDKEKLRREIQQFLHSLEEEGLLEWHESNVIFRRSAECLYILMKTVLIVVHACGSAQLKPFRQELSVPV
jgi:Coenzyme PQQ synthesis protein D (PqqD)